MRRLVVTKKRRVKTKKKVNIYRRRLRKSFKVLTKRIWLRYMVCSSLKDFEFLRDVVITKICKIVIRESISNILITILKFPKQNVLYSSSSGRKFKGTEKNSTYAAEVLGFDIGKFCIEKGFTEGIIGFVGRVRRRTRGVFKGLLDSGLKIRAFDFKIKKAHNGCRPCKKTRK